MIIKDGLTSGYNTANKKSNNPEILIRQYIYIYIYIYIKIKYFTILVSFSTRPL